MTNTHRNKQEMKIEITIQAFALPLQAYGSGCDYGEWYHKCQRNYEHYVHFWKITMACIEKKYKFKKNMNSANVQHKFILNGLLE